MFKAGHEHPLNIHACFWISIFLAILRSIFYSKVGKFKSFSAMSFSEFNESMNGKNDWGMITHLQMFLKFFWWKQMQLMFNPMCRFKLMFFFHNTAFRVKSGSFTNFVVIYNVVESISDCLDSKIVDFPYRISPDSLNSNFIFHTKPYNFMWEINNYDSNKNYIRNKQNYYQQAVSFLILNLIVQLRQQNQNELWKSAVEWSGGVIRNTVRVFIWCISVRKSIF